MREPKTHELKCRRGWRGRPKGILGEQVPVTAPLSSKTKTPRVIGRLCAICGKRGGNTEGFNTFLMRNAIPGEKAHPRCVREYGEAHARLFELRCRSKRGEYLSPDDMRFLMDCNKKWPLAYGALGKAVFAETAPFGSRL